MSLLARTCSTERMNVSRVAARILIVVGGIIWAIMTFASTTMQSYGNLTYSFSEVTSAGINAIIPALLTAGVFVLAMYYERLAAIILFAGAAAVIVYGLVMGWQVLLWASVFLTLIVPMAVSAFLLLLAASTQRVCELEAQR